MNEMAAYNSDNILIWEWPQPVCEIGEKTKDGGINVVAIRTKEDAAAVIESLNRFVSYMESVGDNSPRYNGE